MKSTIQISQINPRIIHIWDPYQTIPSSWPGSPQNPIWPRTDDHLPGWTPLIGKLFHGIKQNPWLYMSILLWLVVGPPLWKIWKSIGMIRNPICGKIKNGNQTTNQSWIPNGRFRLLAWLLRLYSMKKIWYVLKDSRINISDKSQSPRRGFFFADGAEKMHMVICPGMILYDH